MVFFRSYTLASIHLQQLTRYLHPSSAIVKNQVKSIMSFQTRKLADLPSQNFSLVFSKAKEYGDKIAVIDNTGKHTYRSLLARSLALSELIDQKLPNEKNTRLAFLCPSNSSYIVSQWGCWLSKHVTVPLNENYPKLLLKYYIEDSQATLLLTTESHQHILNPIAEELKLPLMTVDDVLNEANLDKFLHLSSHKANQNEIDKMRSLNAVIMYTSGTTGPPKGVVLTHSNLHAQVSIVLEAWKWTPDDVMLNTLPLHHTHGIIYALLSPLYIGGTCVMLPKFDAKEVWRHLISSDAEGPRVNMYTAVPTMYVKLLEMYRKQFGDPLEDTSTRQHIRKACMEKIRLMVSGSSALPEPIMQQWEAVTGHKILERYGMTEIGMVLSNPLNGPRIPGTVGTPLPGVEVQILKPKEGSADEYDIIAEGNSKGTHVTKGLEIESGELVVRGPNVFLKYWNKPDPTKKAFTKDGFFKTGDTVTFQDGVYSILGRTSADIIKSGGYKISALDIERCLLSHSTICDCAVVGLPDPTWGERVAAVIETRNKAPLTTDEIKAWCKQHLAFYCVPTVIEFVEKMPRNVTGKVNKKELIKKMFPNVSNIKSKL